jgi:hypothetical protein
MAEQKSINDVLSDVMEQWFDERVKGMQGTLMKFGITSGQNILPEDIKVPANVPTAQGIKAELELPDYYEFVDEGVGASPFVPFSFAPKQKQVKTKDKAKKETKNKKAKALNKTDKYTPKAAPKPPVTTSGRFSFKTPFGNRKMIDSIREWGARKGRQGVTAANMDSVAFLTARKIKRTGLRQTMFFTDNFQEQHIRELEKRIETATGLQFELTLTIDPDNRAVRVQG